MEPQYHQLEFDTRLWLTHLALRITRRAKTGSLGVTLFCPLVMPMYNIDDFDLKILTLLQSNGRLTNQELSELIGLSASQCSGATYCAGAGAAYSGLSRRGLAPDAVGQEMLGLIEVRLLNHTPECVASFHQMVSGVDAILDAYKTTGDNDYLLKVAVSDLPGLNHVISGILAQNKSVAHLKTSVVLHRLKENGLSMPVKQYTALIWGGMPQNRAKTRPFHAW